MGIEYRIEKSIRTMFGKVDGVITYELITDYQDSIRDDPDFERGYNHLLDMRGIERNDVTADQTRMLAYRNPFGPDARRAIVVADDATYGRGRMFMAHANLDEDRVMVFRDMVEARRWLGLTDSPPKGSGTRP